MTFKEYGVVVEPAKARGSFQEFGEEVSPLSRPRSLINAPTKGAIKRGGDIAEFAQSIAPFLPKGPLSKEKAHKFAEEKFPTFSKEPERFLERAGGVAAEALLSPGGLAAKAIQIPVGAALGHVAEKFGAPEWAQAIAEGLPFFYSGTKKIPLKKNQKELGNFLRKQGLTENEITPLLKTPEQINLWGTFASKGKKSRELMESLYNKTGKVYDSVIEEGKKLRPLNEAEITKIKAEFSKILDDTPSVYRNLIKEDLADFYQKGRFGAEDLINLDKDINAILGPQRTAQDVIGRLKKPINEALESIDPSISKDYSLAKELYKSRSRVKGSLINPKDLDKFMDIGEAYGLGAGIFNRDLGMIAKVIGVSGGRQIAREMLINPRLQNISLRIGESLKKNKLNLSIKYLKQFRDETAKTDEDLASQIDELFSK